jgi:uncharacterized protein YndB with AHSA1/START domain
MNDESNPRELTLTWTLDAPPDEVFRAWTDPSRLDWFYNPEQPIPDEPIELDLRVGGAWRQHMVIDETTRYVTGGVYREIVPNERLVFAWGATGGWPALDPDRPEDSPLVALVLTPAGDGTEMTIHVEFPESFTPESQPAGWFDLIQNGWRVTVDRLVSALGAGAPAS